MKTIILIILFIFSFKSYSVSVEDHPLIYESYSLEAQGKYPQAIEKMTQLFAKKSSDYFVNYRLGWLFSLHQKYKNATEHYRKAAEIVPESLEPWLALSLLSLNLGEWEKAMNYSSEVIKRSHGSYYGHLRFISAAIQAKRCDLALDKIITILKFYPTDVIFLEQKAYCFESLQKIEDAKRAVVELKLLSPQNVYANTFMRKYK